MRPFVQWYKWRGAIIIPPFREINTLLVSNQIILILQNPESHELLGSVLLRDILISEWYDKTSPSPGSITYQNTTKPVVPMVYTETHSPVPSTSRDTTKHLVPSAPLFENDSNRHWQKNVPSSTDMPVQRGCLEFTGLHQHLRGQTKTLMSNGSLGYG